MYENPYLIQTIITLALVGFASLSFSISNDILPSRKRIVRFVVLRAIVTFLLLSGSLLGWFRSHSIALSVLAFSVLSFLFIGGIEFLIRKERRRTRPPQAIHTPDHPA